MKLDIQSTIQIAFLISVLAVIISVWMGIRWIQAGQKLHYYHKRQSFIHYGWRLIFIGIALSGLSYLINRFAEPIAYRIFPPSPTVTLTPTITLTTTITIPPTVTLTPSDTPTPAISDTPSIPKEVQPKVTPGKDPNPDAIFSPLQFGLEIDENKVVINPTTEFTNPLTTIHASYSYDGMTEGASFVVLWVRLDKKKTLLYSEASTWAGSTGGYGHIECTLPSADWLPDDYEVQFYLGGTWKTSSRFTVSGPPPTSTLTVSPTATLSTTPLPSPTPTISPTGLPTETATITATRQPSSTRPPLPTPTITRPRRPTATRQPSQTFIAPAQ